jgi:nucleoside-diphosphate-sugar epimerase
MQVTIKQWLALLATIGSVTALLWISSLYAPEPAPPRYGPPYKYWVPSEADKAMQDSMLEAVQSTHGMIDTIGVRIDGVYIRLMQEDELDER